MEQLKLINDTVKYIVVKQKQKTKLFLMSYCSVCDFLENYNTTVNRKELCLTKLKNIPRDTLFYIDDEPLWFIANKVDNKIVVMKKLSLNWKSIFRQHLKQRELIADIFGSRATPP